MDYTIIGNEVNLASRLETSATSGMILIAKETYALICDDIECVEKESIEAKGFDRPVPTYQVIGPNTSFKEGGQIKEERDGFSISLDPSAIDEGQRQEILEYLRSAISILS